MNWTIRRLKPGEEALVQALARADADFDLAGRGGALEPLGPNAARAFLADPSVLFWTAGDKGGVRGFLFCYFLKMRAGKSEVLLYEIGVHKGFRRQGVGKALQGALEAWMRKAGVREAWVLADNSGAVKFYKACGFKVPKGRAVYMTKRLAP